MCVVKKTPQNNVNSIISLEETAFLSDEKRCKIIWQEKQQHSILTKKVAWVTMFLFFLPETKKRGIKMIQESNR